MKKIKSIVKKGTALLCAVTMLAGILPGISIPVLAADKTDISSYAPEGYENVALKKSVTSSSSYEMSNEGWCNAHLVDGVLGTAGSTNGWTTSPYDGVTDPNVPAWVTIDLGKEYEIKQVGLFPRSDATYGECFPVDFQVKVSADNETWSEIYDVAGMQTPEGPVIVELDETVKGQYVQLYVSGRTGADKEGAGQSSDGKLVQLSEMAVWGISNKVTVKLNKSATRLLPGEKDVITAEIDDAGLGNVTLVWSSDDESIATVDQDGVITAVAIGTTNIHVKNEEHDIDKSIHVSVVESEFSYDDNILISIFWPPTLEYMSSGEGDKLWDEQYKLLHEAGINLINNVTGNDLNAKATNLKMLEYADKYGMVVSVADSRFGGNLRTMTQEEIEELILEYKNMPGLGGYYILDEPSNANPYLSTYIAMKNADSDSYMHLNFLPYAAYSDIEIYKDQMRDWLRLSEAAGYPQDYLMYDLYPYPYNSTAMNRTGFLTNMHAVWEVGKESDVKTATYLQSVCIPGAYRSPSVAEIRYEAMMALAYGYKQLSYFTWFTPSNRSEPFEDGIILLDGQPNSKLYGGITELNGEIHALGNVLINLDAEEVYLNGETWGRESIPEDFFAQPTDQTNYTVSFLRNADTGRNYMMVVNNDYENSASIKLNLDAQITNLMPVSKEDGSLGNNVLVNGKLEVELAAGDGMLYALPEGVDYYESNIKAQEKGENLALDAYVIADTSTGENLAYISNLNDGIRRKTNLSDGWTSATEGSAVITIDLKTERTINRVDIYSAGEGFEYGSELPKTFDIQVSEDGVEFETVKSVTDFGESGVPEAIEFAEQSARYIRLVISESQGKKVSIAELEVYLDDGTIPAPEDQREAEEIVDYVNGENIALNKKVFVSSSTPDGIYQQWGWSSVYVNDGNTGNGWTSNVGLNMSTENAEEWVMIDLGDAFDIDSVKLMPTGTFAVDYVVEISDNGKNDWKTISTVTGDDKDNKGWRIFEISDDTPISGRYLRVKSSKLNSGGADGYLMQIAEIEAYGTPLTDKTEAKVILEKAEALKNSVQVDTTALKELMQNLSNAIDSDVTTQKRLDDWISKVKAEMDSVEKAQADYEASLLKPEQDKNSSSKEKNDKEPVETHYADNKASTSTTTTAANAKTGDSAMIAELCVAMLICVAGIVFVYVKRRKKDLS